MIPIPSHSSHAPYGLLNENSLGSISSIVNPLSGHANLDEKIFFSIFLYALGIVSFSYSTKSNPFDIFSAVSTLSASRFPILEFKTILSTNIEISCLIFLFSSGISLISYSFPSTFAFLKPLFL